MKKYVMLSAFTLLAVAGIAISGSVFRNSMIAVNVVKVEPLTVENAVTCTGRVERAQTTNVYVPIVSVTNKIYVSVGDEVKVGQPLLSVGAVPKDKNSSENESTYQSLINNYQQGLNSSSSSPSSTAENSDEEITAPTAGEITSISVERLGYAYPSKPVMAIASNSDLQIRLSVSESQISDVKVGQKAIITGVGFKNTSYSGTVKKISSEAKQVTSATGQETVIEVIVSVANSNADIKPGFTAQAKIITSKYSGVLIAPYEAVRADDSGNEYVFKLSGTKAVKVPVTTSREFDDGFEIKSGLSKNDNIIVNPDKVTNGVFVIPSLKGAVKTNG